MSLYQRLNTFLSSKKGNALLFTMVAAIMASMGGYLFVALTDINDAQKQKIAHLYNAFKMGEGTRGFINGVQINESRFGNESYGTIIDKVGAKYDHDSFIKLSELVKDGIIFIPEYDPTPVLEHDREHTYNLDLSGVTVQYLDEDGNEIDPATGGETTVDDVNVLVNLAGTPDAVNNAPFTSATAFYYVLMDKTTADAGYASGADVALKINVATILSPGLAPETSVRIPRDNDGYKGLKKGAEEAE